MCPVGQWACIYRCLVIEAWWAGWMAITMVVWTYSTGDMIVVRNHRRVIWWVVLYLQTISIVKDPVDSSQINSGRVCVFRSWYCPSNAKDHMCVCTYHYVNDASLSFAFLESLPCNERLVSHSLVIPYRMSERCASVSECSWLDLWL